VDSDAELVSSLPWGYHFSYAKIEEPPMHKFAVAIMLALFAACSYSQDAAPKADQQDTPEMAAKKAVERDLNMLKGNLITQSQDLESITESLRGVDADNAMLIDQRAGQGVTYLDATYWYLVLYDRMQCGEDKDLAKFVLRDRLSFYAHLLDMIVDQTNRYLELARVPAVAQQGQQIRDELRNAKVKLDEIAASLK
jgi:hypothetical protein